MDSGTIGIKIPKGVTDLDAVATVAQERLVSLRLLAGSDDAFKLASLRGTAQLGHQA
jgi:hypothetical protein